MFKYSVMSLWIFFVLFLHSGFGADLNLFLLTHGRNVGDRSQILRLEKDLKNGFKKGQVHSEEFDLSSKQLSEVKKKIEEQIEESQKQDQLFLLLTVGESGLEGINALSGIKGLKTGYLSHQVTSKLYPLLDKTDLLVLPKHTITPELLRKVKSTHTQLVQTIGVLHNLTTEDLSEAVKENGHLVPQSENYLAIILAGDAPAPSGKVQHFPVKEAKKLAAWIALEASKRNAYVLVLNGPRTGLYFPNSNLKNSEVHRDGHKDKVTLAFVEELYQKLPKERVKLFDFQFGEQSQYKTVLGLVLKRSGELFVPGESTSMISESVELLPGKVTIYENSAMNPTHRAHVRSEYQAGRVSILTLNYKVKTRLRQANASTRAAGAGYLKEILQWLSQLSET